MSEWKEYVLEDVIDKFIDYRGKTPKKTDSGVPLVTAKIVKSGRILEPNEFIARKDYDNWMTRGLPEIDDIVLTTEAPLGEIALIKDKNIALAQRVITLRAKKNMAYNPFIKYYFQSAQGQYELESRASGTTVFGIKAAVLKKVPILLPPLPKQKAIAAVLSSLDDKIDLLHHQNKTLEAMAETLFRQWFVEEVQAGWAERPLSGIADFLNGLACQKYTPKNEIDKLPVLKIKELKNGFSEDSDWATTDVNPEYFVESGDVIFSWSASLLVKIWDGKKCILNQHLFKVTSTLFPKWFYYQWCKYHLEEFISIASSHATTMGHIKRGDLDTAMVLVPSITELEKMNTIMQPITDKTMENNNQIHTLEKLRDTLLPKLMSGEVRIAV
ncbi:restriction endonuclease subunit S [Candidatus Margulisiibacteriota bacterium]